MDLIIGGVYQGKLQYAMDTFGVREDEVFRCADEPVLDTSKRCVYGFEAYLRACLRAGAEPELPEHGVVICQDIFCGVVPLTFEERQWRELTGRSLTALAAKADTVTRIFCGLPQRLK